MRAIEIEQLGKRYKLENNISVGKRFSSWLKQTLKPQTIPFLNKSNKEIWALKEINLKIDEGEVLGIIGRNGAGKTTLLKVLAHVTLPTEGQAVIRGRVSSLLELGMGFQPDLSARENIYLSAAMYGRQKKEVAKCFDDIIKFAELERFVDTPAVKHFSSGMYVRLAFSVVINMKPDILLADEVLAVGDISFQKKCIERMGQIGRSGATVLFVSHDMEAIRRLCTRAICLDEGRIVDEGKPDDVVDRYQNRVWTAQLNLEQNDSALNDFGRIVSVGLLNDSRQTVGTVKVQESFYIQVLFELFQQGINLRCRIELMAGDIQVLRSLQPEDFFVNEEGVFEGLCRIPGGLLMDQPYTVNVSIILLERNGAEINRQIREYRTLSFTPVDPDGTLDSNRKYIKNSRFGVVMPKLDWAVTSAGREDTDHE